MRKILIALVVANLLAWVAWHGGFDDWLSSPREPDRPARQVNADRLEIVVPGTATADAAAAPGAGAAAATPAPPAAMGAATPASTGATAASAPAAARESTAAQGGASRDVVAPGEACIETGPLEDARAQRVRDFVSASGGQIRSIPETVEGAGLWMVYTGPFGSAPAAQRRLTELQRLGVSDLYLIQEGSYRNAISFGLFRSEERARTLMEGLGRDGVPGVQRVRPNPGEPKTAFQLRYAADLPARSPELANRLANLGTALGIKPESCHARP